MTVRAGINLQACGAATERTILERFRPGVVVFIDIPNASHFALVHSWGGLVVARRWFDGSDQWGRVADDPYEAASYCYGKIAEMYGQVWGQVDYFCGFNEYVGNDKFVNISTDGNGQQYDFGDLFEQYGMDANADPPPGAPDYYERDLRQNLRIARWTSHYECQMFKLFDQQAPTGKYLALSMPRGNMEWWQWKLFEYACLEELGRFPGHGYSTHNDYWQTNRGPWHRDSFDPANEYLTGRDFFFIGKGKHNIPLLHTVPWLYTEAGVDGGRKDGYKSIYGGNGQAYAGHIRENLAGLDELASDCQQTVIGAAYFVTGYNAVWKDFDFSDDPEVRAAIRDWPKTHTEYKLPEPQPEEPPVYEFEGAFVAYAQEHPEVGAADGPLDYDQKSNAFQQTTAGTLAWWDKLQEVRFYPTGAEILEPELPAAPVPSMDVASYQPRDLTELIAQHQIKHVIVKAYQPGENVSQEHTKAQIESAKANGCAVSLYVFLYAAWDARQQVRDALLLAAECGIVPEYLWLDYETYKESSGAETIPTPDQLAEACDECERLDVKPGIYTGAWCAGPLGERFAGYPLWAAQYDGIPDPDVFTPFGGWQQCAIKQYSADGIDLDIARPEYVPGAPPPVEPPTEEPEPTVPLAQYLEVAAERDRYRIALENIRVQTEVLGS